jgi:hypothetical protein
MNNDFETINLIVSIIGQFGTWISIIIVFFTLKEMQKQRRESYKPVVVIPTFGLSAKSQKRGDLVFFDILYPGIDSAYEKQKLSVEESTKTEKQKRLYHLTIHNLGVGAALDVEITWKLDFDLSATVIDINGFCQNNSIPITIRIEGDTLVIKYHQNSVTTRLINSCGIEPVNVQRDYLLPQSVDPLGISLFLPVVYQELILLIATSYSKEHPELLSLSLPTILCVRYRDIGNKWYSRKYRLHTELSFVAGAEFEDRYFHTLIKASQI